MRIEAHTVPCPFKVGDRIQELRVHPTTFSHGRIIDYRTPEPDYSRPLATVTEITASGFLYEYDTPISWIPRWGMMIYGGECYAAGYGGWRRVNV